MHSIKFRRKHGLQVMTLAAIVLTTTALLVFANQKQVTSIPPSSIVTTSSQENMRYFDNVFSKQTGQNQSEAAREFARAFQLGTPGASNAFLVDAPNESGAIEASRAVYFGGRSAETPVTVNQPNPKRGNYWLAVYLGIGPSGPTSFVIEKASIDGDTIRLTYSRPKPSAATADIHHYYYWVPLGKLQPAEYQIDLFDSGQKKVTLFRRVVLQKEGKAK
jgi:hypothetical protein